MASIDIAFFDLARTLTTANVGWLWLRREVALGHVRSLDGVKLGSVLVLHRLGLVGDERAAVDAIRLLEGARSHDVISRTKKLFADEVRGRYRREAIDEIERLRGDGTEIVLASSASWYLVRLVADELGIHRVLATRFEIDDHGRFTGRPLGRACAGTGKLAAARELAAQKDTTLDRCAFYTSCYTDTPLLEAVGTPVVVAPDARLAPAAHRRKWRVLAPEATERPARPDIGAMRA